MTIDEAIKIAEDYSAAHRYNSKPNSKLETEPERCDIFNPNQQQKPNCPEPLREHMFVYSLLHIMSDRINSTRNYAYSIIHDYSNINDLKDYIIINVMEFATKILNSNLSEFKTNKLKKIVTEDNINKSIPQFTESNIAVELFRNSLTKELNGKMALRYLEKLSKAKIVPEFKRKYQAIIVKNSNITKELFTYCIDNNIKILNYQTIRHYDYINNVTSTPIFSGLCIRQILSKYKISYSHDILVLGHNSTHIESDLNTIQIYSQHTFDITQDYLKAVDVLIHIENILSKHLLDYRQWLIDIAVTRSKNLSIWNGYNAIHKHQAITTIKEI